MSRDRIGAEWRSYRTRVMPVDAPVIQAVESRRAFYAGASALWRVVLAVLEPGTEPTAADLRAMDEIAAELDAFARSVQDGRA